MKKSFEERALELGDFIAENGATVRSAAKKFGISKSTVHTDVAKRKGAGAYGYGKGHLRGRCPW